MVLTLITVVMWITLNIYRAISTKPAPSVPEQVSKQLIPSLDKDAIAEVDKRILLDDSQIPSAKFNTITASPIPTSRPILVASPSAIPTPNQSTSSSSQQ